MWDYFCAIVCECSYSAVKGIYCMSITKLDVISLCTSDMNINSCIYLYHISSSKIQI